MRQRSVLNHHRVQIPIGINDDYAEAWVQRRFLDLEFPSRSSQRRSTAKRDGHQVIAGLGHAGDIWAETIDFEASPYKRPNFEAA